MVAERATSGLVVGVDPSVEMLRQVASRNEAAVQAGRLELRRGEVSALPYPDEFFTKACVIHSVYFWPSIEDGLRQFHRVLGPDGLLILAVRMRREDASVLAPSRYGLIDTQIDEIVASLGEVGFRDATRERREIGRETIAAIVTHK